MFRECQEPEDWMLECNWILENDREMHKMHLENPSFRARAIRKYFLDGYRVSLCEDHPEYKKYREELFQKAASMDLVLEDRGNCTFNWHVGQPQTDHYWNVHGPPLM